MIQEIRNQVQERANNAHAEVITALFNKNILCHNSHCGCDYCKILSVYVGKKIVLQRLLRSDNIDEYWNSCSWRRSQGIADTIHRLRSEIKELKIEKDRIKKKVILYNILRYV